MAIELEFDNEPRIVSMSQQLTTALAKNKQAQIAFEKLSPSRQREINRYLASLRTEESVERNVEKIIRFLTGKKTPRLLFR